MPRIPRINEADLPHLADTIAGIKQGRRGQLLDLYRVLLHSPDVAKAWFDFSNAIRWKTELSGRLRELVIVRIGHLMRADYILAQHVPTLTRAEGISAEECAALAEWRPTSWFAPQERAALAYTDAVTAGGPVDDAIGDDLSRHFNERQIVELTVLIGFFNMAARVMSALQIAPQISAGSPARLAAASAAAPRRSIQSPPVIVIEDDVFLRVIGIVLDPSTPAERRRAFADFVAHDEPDFDGYCKRLRDKIAPLFPATVRFVTTPDELRDALPGAHLLLIESLPVGERELDAAPDLALIQQFGSMTRHIDVDGCVRRGIGVLSLHRRSSGACAETAITLMLTLAKKIHRLAGRISPDQLEPEFGPLRPYDRRHTPNSNWARIPGLRTLNEATLGIVGVGEIGRGIVVRAAALGMRILYTQRTRLPQTEERAFGITYAPLDQLLAESDWVVPQVPSTPSTRNMFDRQMLARMKPGACLVNISRADLVDRDALIEALSSGHLGGFALDPLYEAPGRSDDELLRFPNVVLTPHIAAAPRLNVLKDFDEMLTRMARELTPAS